MNQTFAIIVNRQTAAPDIEKIPFHDVPPGLRTRSTMSTALIKARTATTGRYSQYWWTLKGPNKMERNVVVTATSEQ
jgi:hypothetical protein